MMMFYLLAEGERRTERRRAAVTPSPAMCASHTATFEPSVHGPSKWLVYKVPATSQRHDK